MIVSWNTTNKCNMYCKHCYRNSGIEVQNELNTREGKSLLDEIAKAGFKIMIFSGGEPLMRPDIYELIRYASEIGLRPVLGSNGTLITVETAMRLKDAGVMGIGISLDSLDMKKHDTFRNYKNGWNKAVAGMKICRKVGLPFQIHTTVMNWNKDEISDIIDFAVNIGASAHHIFFLVPTGRGINIENEMLGREEYEKTLKNIMLRQKEVSIELKPTCAPQFTRIAAENNVKTRFRKGCLAGTSYCIISPRGDVQACPYMDASVGNIRQIPFSRIWSENSVLKKLRTSNYKGKCGSCSYGKICGGCRARAAFYSNGDIMAEDIWCSYSDVEEEKVNSGQ
ncbi:MAG: putative heme d1 biosynthesis radical SAM protein NirJ2 [Clostridium sp.]|jgi:putative heme d1 biosynthesis radical SAM protein NirJ2|uniref:putative heme d1 biosynthesis radical SAM protein NirJ2 n=1 Tax=Clostridium sp. TaxID=1506 RepID=UPI0025BA8AEF|nr:putative heme d1 biosynthesis radical SAM protein NirJ2 [Clostridium sp.]MCH3963541.1 putative heme d1 biosynthesis radical SAM protein NirJ2 [Clostridium sp.]MCI1714682.1 putative heme d1 biosynthesis radical SAM protein NirJ2 [Clostridium sp.]MCI1799129.1 putative heme d1 biosynthesis radical SAM protein NirJ2 [Clostridium sp.]MCI1812865.1 putative heme d1 biosynthesis radical SAM protein NirJ2 [Clostridium sp.]MCI1869755.1 putative heme d1 biosynthesis radical SAM protein NirJ2 [Clostrid